MILGIQADNTIDRQGVATPKGTLLVRNEHATIVIKVPGHKYWSSLGKPFSYAPASFVVYRIVDELGDSQYRVERLTDFPVKS